MMLRQQRATTCISSTALAPRRPSRDITYRAITIHHTLAYGALERAARCAAAAAAPELRAARCAQAQVYEDKPRAGKVQTHRLPLRGLLLTSARINSQQQLHIRTLENERSRLVAENCSLAQRVIHLQNTLEAHQHAPSFAPIESIKGQLEAKIQELGGLVAELGSLSRRKLHEAREGERMKTATRKSPEERQWRSALGLQEVENAMLPTINESKAYPRMTMKYAVNPAPSQTTDTDYA